MENEVTLSRDRLECVVRELSAILNNPTVDKLTVRIESSKIVLTPICSAVEVTI